MKTTKLQHIHAVAGELGLKPDELRPYGDDRAKINPAAVRQRRRNGASKMILVSAITPTSAGEGKTTTTIGLGDALRRRGESVAICLREPSLGPCFGLKGGGTGGGRAQLHPAVDINLHFTGDFHAISAAHNLLAAAVDNHVHRGNTLRLDPRRTFWRRVMDVNDRALRNVVTGLGGHGDGVPREAGFDITAASEVMAMLCLAEDADDLRRRIGRTLIGFTYDKEPVLAERFNVTGAMLALMRDVLWPNLVQTLEGTPALVHGGPFANIAHGCNSVIATKAALNLADYVVTEAGFGVDLGAEKFFDIKCMSAGLDPWAVVLVATVRALKMHGGARKKSLDKPNPDALRAGLENLDKHLEIILGFGEYPIVALNRFGSDSDEEIAIVRDHCAAVGVTFVECDHFAEGGAGALGLADAIIARAHDTPFTPSYAWADSVPDKIAAIAKNVYGARQVLYTVDARKDLKLVEKYGYAGLPICMAKTPNSLSDDPRRYGRPDDFDITVRRIHVAAGAGFLVTLCGDILRMPGLPSRPRAQDIDLVDGEIVGLVT